MDPAKCLREPVALSLLTQLSQQTIRIRHGVIQYHGILTPFFEIAIARACDLFVFSFR